MYLYVLVIPSIVIFYMVFLNICKHKFYIHEIAMSFFITYIAVVATMFVFINILPTIGIDIPGNMVIMSSLFLLSYRKTKQKLLSCYYALMAALIAMVGGSMVNSWVGLIFNISFDNSRNDLFLYFITLAPVFPFCYFMSRYLGNYIDRCYTQLSNEVKREFVKYGCILSALTYVLSHINLFAYILVDDIILLSSINVIIIAIILFISIIMTAAYSISQQNQLETVLKYKAEESLSDHIKNLEREYRNMRSFRHDYRNLLCSLLGHDDIEELKKHLAESLEYADESLKSLDSIMAKLNLISISELKGLLAIKCANAQAMGINVELTITDPVYNIPLNRVDLCRVVGIIVDNSVEELVDNDYNSKILKLSIVVDECEVLIICSNPYKFAPNVRKMFDEGYSTKGANRGLGLSNLKQVCKENKNLSYTICMENNEFTFIMSIRRV